MGWRRSGQSAPSYAAAVGVSASSLHRWSSLLAAPSAERPGLVEVVASEPESSWGWELELPAGTLRARGALDAQTARAVVEALAGAKRR